MKTIDIVTMPKGYYLTTRYNGSCQNREYALNARVKELRKQGYAEA